MKFTQKVLAAWRAEGRALFLKTDSHREESASLRRKRVQHWVSVRQDYIGDPYEREVAKGWLEAWSETLWTVRTFFPGNGLGGMVDMGFDTEKEARKYWDDCVVNDPEHYHQVIEP